MGYFDRADRLLNKRCDFLESQLQWPSNVPATPTAGKKYLHFIGQGLTAFRTRDYSENAYGNYSAHFIPARIGAHHRGLYGLTYEASRSTSVNWADWNAHGVNPFDHFAHTALGHQLRYEWCTKMYYALNVGGAGLLRNSSDQITQLYKGWQIAPDDPAASWSFQQLSLLEQARLNPLKSLLGQQHVVDSENKAYAWSARQAGFNLNNFKGSHYGSGYIPEDTYKAGRTSSRTRWTPNQILHHSPTILLMTMEVPEDFDVWLADSNNSGQAAPVKLYQRWVSVPHWIGYATCYDWYYHSPGSNDYLNSPGYVDDYASLVTSVHIYDAYNSNDNMYGDTYLYTPADAYNEYLTTPEI